MLKRSIFICLFMMPFLSPLQASEEEVSLPKEHEWIMSHIQSLSQCQSNEEVIDCLVSLNTNLQSRGYQDLSLGELCLSTREYLIKQGIYVDDHKIEEVYNEIVKKEGVLSHQIAFSQAVNQFPSHSCLEIKKSQNLQLADGFSNGFVKVLGGALFCIIPHPITWGIGGSLIADGIKEMIDYVREFMALESFEESSLRAPSHSLKIK